MVSGGRGDPTVCVPGPVVEAHVARLGTATSLSKSTQIKIKKIT